MMVCGIPKCTQTHTKKSLTVAFVVIIFLQAVNMAIVENISMTTNTQSLPCLVEGRTDIFSMDMDSQGRLGAGKGMYRPCFLMVGVSTP